MEMLLTKINECYGAMERISRVILRAGLAVIGATYFAVILLLALHGRLFPDYDTALCAAETLLACAKELSGAIVIPVLLYETLGRAVRRGGR